MKAVLYCHISASDFFALDLLLGQQARMPGYAGKHSIEIVEIYPDVCCLGSTVDNPGMQAVREGKAYVILVEERRESFNLLTLEEAALYEQGSY